MATENHTPFIIRDRQVKEILGISPTQARRLAEQGILKRRKFGPGIVGYIHSEAIEALIKNAS